MDIEEIKRPFELPTNSILDLVEPEKWVNIPICMVRGFKETIDRIAQHETLLQDFNRKVSSLGHIVNRS
jgi:predicted P-loop ATPase/GTPase